MTMARREIVAEGEVGAYHCTARCVRRAYLCGKDLLTGKSFDHRKEWVRHRLEVLAGAFAIDVGSYAVMDNHLHVILRIRPDVAKAWSAEDVTRNWRKLFGRQPISKTDSKSQDLRIEVESSDQKLVALRRARLASVSWFMKALVEPIARRANVEDNCKGRFWEGRFRCQALLDDAALLACSAYVDLNPVRAGIVKTPEAARFTSAADRISQSLKPARNGEDARDGWLSPLPKSNHGKPASSEQKSLKTKSHRRASNDEWISLGLDDYLQLLDWTGRQIRQDKAGSIPKDLSPILDRLKLQPEGWVECVRNFGRWFKNAAGSPAHLKQRAEKSKRRWFQGLSPCKIAFR